MGEERIFSCRKHKKRLLCSLCHEYRSEMQIYEKLTSKIKCIPSYRSRISIQQLLEPSWNKMEREAITNVNLLCSNWLNHESFADDICRIIILYLDTDSMKFAKHYSLVDVFAKIWNLLCFDSQPSTYRKKKVSKRDKGIAYNEYSTKFRAHRLQMSENELCKLSKTKMWKKRMDPNTQRMQYAEFKSCYFGKPFFEKIDDKISEICFLLGKIMYILSDHSDDFKAMHLILNEWSFNDFLGKRPVYCKGKGKCIIFTVDNSQDSDLYAVIQYHANQNNITHFE